MKAAPTVVHNGDPSYTYEEHTVGRVLSVMLYEIALRVHTDAMALAFREIIFLYNGLRPTIAAEQKAALKRG